MADPGTCPGFYHDYLDIRARQGDGFAMWLGASYLHLSPKIGSIGQEDIDLIMYVLNYLGDLCLVGMTKLEI